MAALGFTGGFTSVWQIVRAAPSTSTHGGDMRQAGILAGRKKSQEEGGEAESKSVLNDSPKHFCC